MPGKVAADQREHERVYVEFPVVYTIGRNTLTGSTVNASNEGMMVESYVSSRTALRVFKILCKKPGFHLIVEYTYKENTYLRASEIRHFHLDYSGSEPYRLTVGFWIPKTR